MSAIRGERSVVVMATNVSDKLDLDGIAQEIYTRGVLGVKETYLKEGAFLRPSWTDWRYAIMLYLQQVTANGNEAVILFWLNDTQKSVCKMLFADRFGHLTFAQRRAVRAKVLALLALEIADEALSDDDGRGAKSTATSDVTKAYTDEERASILELLKKRPTFEGRA